MTDLGSRKVLCKHSEECAIEVAKERALEPRALGSGSWVL